MACLPRKTSLSTHLSPFHDFKPGVLCRLLLHTHRPRYAHGLSKLTAMWRSRVYDTSDLDNLVRLFDAENSLESSLSQHEPRTLTLFLQYTRLIFQFQYAHC